MPPVPVEIETRPPESPADIEYIDDLDTVVETTMCSCTAGDDNPY